MTAQDSEFLHHEACPECGSKDNLARFDDGHGYCFGCRHYEPGDGSQADEPTDDQRRAHKKARKLMIDPGNTQPLKKRRITESTCAAFGYTVGMAHGKTVQIAAYRDTTGRAVVGQKLRDSQKKITWKGDAKQVQPLWGMHRFNKSKRVVITEGEIDAMTLSQVQGNKWPVVSVKDGASGAAKNCAAALDWLRGFDEIVLWFDDDAAGHAAVQECIEVLPAGKVKVAAAPEGYNDPNEILQSEGDDKLIMQAIWEAKKAGPDGLVNLADLVDDVCKPVEWGLPWWDDRLTQVTYGRRYGEAVALGAGTGVGKTDWITQQITHDVTELGLPVGLCLFEQQPEETGKRLAGKFAGKVFHVPDADWSHEELRDAVHAVADDRRVNLYDHFGQAEWDQVENHIRFWNKAEGIRVFYVDHLTAFASGADNEREELERIMGELGGLVKELDIWVLFVSHLTTPEGKPHEEGGRVQIRQFKGSRSIGYWSHYMFGMERDQQADEEEDRTTTTFRVLKDRYTGRATGQTFLLGYDHDTGMLVQKAEPSNDEDDEFDDEDDIPF